MKAYLKREALNFESNIPDYEILPDTIECDADIEKGIIHLKIPIKKREEPQKMPFKKVLAYLENPNSECDIDRMMSALKVDTD